MWQKVKNLYHLGIAGISNLYFGFPSKKLTVIGVTGTDGKTTTVALLYHILNAAGYKASMISSVGAIIGGKAFDVGFHVTNPASWSLQKFIKQASQVSDYLVLEVTSHGLDQYRVWGIHFTVGVITNVTWEHLDYHKTFEKYLNAKKKLLQMADIAILNKDDKSYRELLKLKHKIAQTRVKNKKWITYAIKNSADVTLKKFPFKTNLIGEFNTYNSLAAVAACKSLGISDEKIRKGLVSFRAPIGRQEIVFDLDFKVIIDFAHTPNAIEKILLETKKITKGRLIHVFGSAGKRDKSKRPVMGEKSCKYSDIIILTAEDPRDEAIEKINGEIKAGIKNPKFNSKDSIFSIPDRKEAITFAIQIARKGDTVICTGKSHEKSMNYGKSEEPWNEHEVIKEALKNKI